MSDLSYLEEDVQSTAILMDQLSGYVQSLAFLKDEVAKAELKLKAAQEKYDDLAKKALPDVFRLNGITSLKARNGLVARVVTHTHVNIKKDMKDKVAQWLEEHNGESLVKRKLVVDDSEFARVKLLRQNIPFVTDTQMNTNSVKSFLLDLLGQKGGQAYITVEDIPNGVNFYQYDEIEIADM